MNETRSRVANETKKTNKAGGDDGRAPVQDARRALAEEKLKAYIERTVASAPPLTSEMRDRLALLLRGAS